jgi:hypothetical protein
VNPKVTQLRALREFALEARLIIVNLSSRNFVIQLNRGENFGNFKSRGMKQKERGLFGSQGQLTFDGDAGNVVLLM